MKILIAGVIRSVDAELMKRFTANDRFGICFTYHDNAGKASLLSIQYYYRAIQTEDIGTDAGIIINNINISNSLGSCENVLFKNNSETFAVYHN